MPDDPGPDTGTDVPDQSSSTPVTGDPDSGAKKALDAERSARKAAERAANAAAVRLKEFEDRDKTEAQKAAEKAADAERRAVDAETRLIRLEVAQAKGLTAAQARRLQGSTREELEADADDLIETFPAAAPKGSPPGKPTERLVGIPVGTAVPASARGAAGFMNDAIRRQAGVTP